MESNTTLLTDNEEEEGNEETQNNKGIIISIYNTVGVPLLVRNHGLALPALALQGLLFAARTSSEENLAPITHLTTKDSKITFKSYDGSMVMALITSNVDSNVR